MSDDLTAIRAELRERAEWIREHHDDTNRPARILVEVDDALALLDALDAAEQPPAYVDVVIDGPPEHLAGRFVEVETPEGSSIRIGEWIERDDGYWMLRIPVSPQPAEPTPATRRERRDADLARLMAEIPPRQPKPPVHMETPGGRHRIETRDPIVTDAQLAISQGLLVDPDSGNLR